MPLSLEVTFETSDGYCSCGFLGTLTRLVAYCGPAIDASVAMCPTCLRGNHKFVLMTPESKIPRAPSRRIRKLSQKQERGVMTELGGRTQPGSGSRPGHKGDGRIFDKYRIEMKLTMSRTFALTRDILNKIRGECSGKEEPVVVVDFKDKATGRTEDRWCVIQYKEFKRIIGDPEQHSGIESTSRAP